MVNKQNKWARFCQKLKKYNNELLDKGRINTLLNCKNTIVPYDLFENYKKAIECWKDGKDILSKELDEIDSEKQTLKLMKNLLTLAAGREVLVSIYNPDQSEIHYLSRDCTELSKTLKRPYILLELK